MQDVRPVVEHAAEAVAAEVADNAAALALRVGLDGGADMAVVSPGFTAAMPAAGRGR